MVNGKRKLVNILEVANCRAKRREMWDSGFPSGNFMVLILQRSKSYAVMRLSSTTTIFLAKPFTGVPCDSLHSFSWNLEI